MIDRPEIDGIDDGDPIVGSATMNLKGVILFTLGTTGIESCPTEREGDYTTGYSVSGWIRSVDDPGRQSFIHWVA